MDDMEEVPGVHGDITNNAGPTPAPGKMERGITQDSFGNIMCRPTVYISSIVKEPHNITGIEEPQGAVETEDLFQQGEPMKPPQTRWTQ
jgi:hypothetical protein